MPRKTVVVDAAKVGQTPEQLKDAVESALDPFLVHGVQPDTGIAASRRKDDRKYVERTSPPNLERKGKHHHSTYWKDLLSQDTDFDK
jgi:hypothetical protein